MADSPTTVAVNIGSQRVSVAVFETSKQGDLVLKGYAADTIVADPAFEASREIQIQVSLKDIVERLNLSKLKVRYAISAQAAFMRFVKLPPIQDDNIEQLVTFEARQHVPFPLNEVVWDYELIEGSKEKEAVIVAIKSDELEDINEMVNATGLVTAEVDVAPMALYNSYRSAYGTSDDAVLIVDIGAKTSSLVYIEGKRFFTRSVQIGGASVSAAIAKEYRVPFAEAENQKIHNGLVALGGGHTDSLDESIAAMAMVIRNALTRLTSDITRTTNYYRSQHNGSAPKKVLLAGGGANLPYTLEFLEEKLGLPVEFFNPLTNLAISGDVDAEVLQQEAHMMGELIGLGLRGVGKSSINIDLVPAAVEQIRDADRRKPFLIAAAAILVAGFGAWALLVQLGAADGSDEYRTISEVEGDLAPHAKKIKALLKKEHSLNEVATAYTDIQEDHTYWFNLIAEVREAFASEYVWLTEMTPVYGYNPNPSKDASTPVTQPQPVIPRNFANSSSAVASMITTPPVVEEEKPRGNSNRREKPEPEYIANAIIIRGFWRENPRSQNIVSDLLKNLRENSTVFKFTYTQGKAKAGKKSNNREAKEIQLSDEDILKPSASGGDDDLAFPFELILPLAKPLTVK